MANEKATIEKLSQQLTELQEEIRFVQIRPFTTAPDTAHTIHLSLALRRARNAFKRLAQACVTLSTLTFAAFLGALFSNKLTQLPAFIILTGALFLALVGYVFFMQAD